MATIATTQQVSTLDDLNRAIAVRDGLRREDDHIFQQTSAYAVSAPGAVMTVPRGEYLRLVARRADVQAALALAEADVEDLRHKLDREREADRQLQADEIRARRRSAIAEFNSALAAAALKNSVVAKFDDELAAIGVQERCSWGSLMPATDRFEGELSLWRAAMRTQGDLAT